MKPILFYFSVITLFSLEGCYVAKPLDRDVRISVNTDFPIFIKNEGNSNFSTRHTEAEYRKQYINDMMGEFANDHIVVDQATPEFIVNITSLELYETTKVDTVKDTSSKDNGMIQELTLAKLKTSGTIKKAAGTTTIAWTADRDKNEELTKSRSVGQIAAGENKDGSSYRIVSFDDNEFVVQSGHCGRRAAVRMAQEIRKQLK